MWKPPILLSLAPSRTSRVVNDCPVTPKPNQGCLGANEYVNDFVICSAVDDETAASLQGTQDTCSYISLIKNKTAQVWTT
jgi:hypothetical protein